jgi:hypothetical protein
VDRSNTPRCNGPGPSPVGVAGKVGALGRGTPTKETNLGYRYDTT